MSSARTEQITLQNERLRLRIKKDRSEIIPIANAKYIFGKLLLSLKARSYTNIVRIVTLARLAPNIATATAEVKTEIDAMWKSVTDSKCLKDAPANPPSSPTPAAQPQSYTNCQ